MQRVRTIIIVSWLCFGVLYAILLYMLDRANSSNTTVYLGTFTATFVLPLGAGLAWALKDTGEIKESVMKTEKLTDDFDDRMVSLVKLAVKNDFDEFHNDINELREEQKGLRKRVDRVEGKLGIVAPFDTEHAG